MAQMNDFAKLAVDAYKGSVDKYSVHESQEALRNALIEANNGKTALDYRDIRDGKCTGLFALAEVLLEAAIPIALQNDDYFNAIVDFRNVPLGDSPVFTVKNNDLFVVAKAADGTQGIRRQRLDGVTETQIKTEFRVVRIYEELNRVLAGRVDFNEMIDRVALSFNQQILNDIYYLWTNATQAQLGGATYFPAAGSYSAANLLTLIEHVEAAAGGKPATIIGTAAALRAIGETLISENTKDEIHNFGYAGKFYGTPVVKIPQRHVPGTTNFVFNDKVLTIVAGDDKPVKMVYEGDPLIIPGDPTSNADLTQEYFYGLKYGAGIVLAGGNAGVGVYTMS